MAFTLEPFLFTQHNPQKNQIQAAYPSEILSLSASIDRTKASTTSPLLRDLTDSSLSSHEISERCTSPSMPP